LLVRRLGFFITPVELGVEQCTHTVDGIDGPEDFAKFG